MLPIRGQNVHAQIFNRCGNDRDTVFKRNAHGIDSTPNRVVRTGKHRCVTRFAEHDHDSAVRVYILKGQHIAQTDRLAVQAIHSQRTVHADAGKVKFQIRHLVTEIIQRKEFRLVVEVQHRSRNRRLLKEIHRTPRYTDWGKQSGIQLPPAGTELLQFIIGQNLSAGHGDCDRPKLRLGIGAVEAVPRIHIAQNDAVRVIDVNAAVVEVAARDGRQAILHDLPVGRIILVPSPDDIGRGARAVGDTGTDQRRCAA